MPGASVCTTELLHPLKRTSSWEIRKQAVSRGMRTLRMDAWDKVLAGTTSVDELLRVTKGEAL